MKKNLCPFKFYIIFLTFFTTLIKKSFLQVHNLHPPVSQRQGEIIRNNIYTVLFVVHIVHCTAARIGTVEEEKTSLDIFEENYEKGS